MRHGRACWHRFVDCDVVVGEVRETSRKPDEMYSLLERLSPGTRKLEIFARAHNCKPGWVSEPAGAQLTRVQPRGPAGVNRCATFSCGLASPAQHR
jgi:N6-adenosine-specific RNA methylase IME4